MYGPGARLELPDCASLGGGSAEPNLEPGQIGIEQVFGHREVSPRFEQERGEKGQGGDGLDEVAAGEQLHEQMRDLQQQIQGSHDLKVLAVAEMLQFVAGLLFVKSFVFDRPAFASSLGNEDDVVRVDVEVG